jgi:hypothetical protein
MAATSPGFSAAPVQFPQEIIADEVFPNIFLLQFPSMCA